jgi:large subunit ribosomal protein L20
MPRVKRGVIHLKKRRKMHKLAKGMMWRRSHLVKQTKVAVRKAGAFARRDRRNKKRSARAVWNIRINAGVRPAGLSYSVFINKLKKAHIELDRKILSTLANEHPALFARVIDEAKKAV